MDNFSQSLMGSNVSAAQSNYQDISGLDNLRKEAQGDEKAALDKVAKQFEGIFMKMLLKSMREANKAFESDSPFNSQGTETYRNMHDDQMALELSESGSLGLADLIVQQLSPQTSGIMPSSALNSGKMPWEKHANNSDKTVESVNNKSNASLNEKSSNFSSKSDFIEKMMPYAEKAAQVIGVSPQTLLAQAALETGWGQKVISQTDGASSHNLFNIKSDKRWNGNDVDIETVEYREGIALKEKASFRAYDSFKESFDDFSEFITTSPRYEKAVDKAANSASFLQELQSAGYATDPNYASKIMGVLKQVTKLTP